MSNSISSHFSREAKIMLGVGVVPLILGLIAASVLPRFAEPTGDNASVTSVKVLDANFALVKLLSQSELKAFRHHWERKQVVPSGPTPEGMLLKLDVGSGPESHRWLYRTSGQIEVLSMKVHPIYQLQDPAAFNRLIGVTP